jgi:hypothetical protein
MSLLGSSLPGADSRFRYVPFDSLSAVDQGTARAMYPHKHAADEKYLYPVKKNGRLARAARYLPR